MFSYNVFWKSEFAFMHNFISAGDARKYPGKSINVYI